MKKGYGTDQFYLINTVTFELEKSTTTRSVYLTIT